MDGYPRPAPNSRKGAAEVHLAQQSHGLGIFDGARDADAGHGLCSSRLFNLPAALSIAAAKTLLIAILFMELRLAKSFVRLAAAAAFVWIAIMFALTFSDLAWRVG